VESVKVAGEIATVRQWFIKEHSFAINSIIYKFNSLIVGKLKNTSVFVLREAGIGYKRNNWL